MSFGRFAMDHLINWIDKNESEFMHKIMTIFMPNSSLKYFVKLFDNSMNPLNEQLSHDLQLEYFSIMRH